MPRRINLGRNENELIETLSSMKGNDIGGGKANLRNSDADGDGAGTETRQLVGCDLEIQEGS